MKPVILVLEDDIQLSDTIKQFLQMHGYDVLCAFDGLQASSLVYEHSVDIMLLDVKVPHLDGLRFLKEEREKGNDIAAIFITSLNSVEDVEKGFEAGCDDYLRKPFALKEMLVRIEALLKRRFATRQDNIAISDNLYFDTKEQRLVSHGKHVPLKTKERKLLTLFLQHPGELLTYDKIFDALWDYNETPSNGSLRTYIKTLRSVLGKDKIETIKNTGYRFVKE